MREPKQARALETRTRILTEASQLFALKGYHDTKLEDILKGASVTTGAFFYHFKGKEDLGFAVIDNHMESRRVQLEEIEQHMPQPRRNKPLQRLLRRLDAIEKMVHEREKGGCIIGNLSTALSDTHGTFRQRLAECFDEMALELKTHLDAAAEETHSRHRLDTWALARYGVAIIEGSIMLARTQQDSRIMKRHMKYLKEHLKQSLQG